MTLSAPARLALRAGSVILLIATVVLAAFAALVPTTPSPTLTAVDPTAIILPEPGVFRGSLTVYGTPAAGERTGPRELGCRLLNERGEPQGLARLSALRVIGDEDAMLGDERLVPLFAVSSWSRGSTIACERGSDAAPMAITAPSTFGSNSALVRAVALSGAGAALVVGVLGLILTRRPRTTAGVAS